MRLRPCISVAVLGVLACAVSAHASPTFFGQVLADWNHVWKYEPAFTNLAPYPWAWPDFDDSTWSSGPGIFAGPITERVPAGRTNLTGFPPPRVNGQVTQYFRTTFEWTHPESVYLTFSNLLDDGAVFYLNGIEIRRVQMPPGQVDYGTLATLGREALEGYDVFVIENPPLVQGPNTLAVELHQASSTSEDMVFGCYVRADQARPPCGWMPTQHFSINILECRSTNLSANVQGFPKPRLQWHKDGDAIDGATNDIYSLTNIGVADQGVYVVTELTELGSCALAVFTVNVIVDGSPLYVEEIVGLLDPTKIRIRFSLPLDQTGAEDLFNYWSDDLMIESAYLNGNPREVLLTTSPRIRGRFYQISLADIFATNGTCGRPQLVELLATTFWIDLETIVMPFEAVWKYDDTGADREVIWREPQYNDDFWPLGPGLLGFETTEATINALEAQGLTVRTPLRIFKESQPGEAIITHYFRTIVDILLPAHRPFTLQHVTDDGAIFYVNGIEAARFNMPNVTINSQTLAWEPLLEGVVRSVPLSGFVPGTNYLAVEVHQITANGGDVLFGAQLVGIVSRDEVPQLRITCNSQTREVTLYWPGRAILEEASSIAGQWSQSPNQSNPQTIAASAAAKFYRLRQ